MPKDVEDYTDLVIKLVRKTREVVESEIAAEITRVNGRIGALERRISDLEKDVSS